MAFNEAYAVSKAEKEDSKLFGPLVDLALVHRLAGNLPMALAVIDKALEYAHACDDPGEQRKREQYCRLHRARFLLFRGEFAESETILNVYDSSDLSERDKASVLQIRGILQVLVGHGIEAERNLGEALEIYTGSQMKRDQIVCLEYIGLNEYFSENYATAVDS